MLNLEQYICKISQLCKSVENIPTNFAEARSVVDDIIMGLDVWSSDKTPQQVKTTLTVILKNYTGDRYNWDWDESQIIIALSVLKLYGFNNEVYSFYELDNNLDEDFNRFWGELQELYPTLDIVKINQESMHYFSIYLYLRERLEDFAEIRGISFVDCAKTAEWHKDFYDNSTISMLDRYIIKDRKKVLRAIDTYIAVYNKPQGKRIALIICALEQYGYISNIDGNIERIIKAFRQRYPDKVSSRQSVSQYLNAHRNPNAKTDKPPFMDEELEMFIKTI